MIKSLILVLSLLAAGPTVAQDWRADIRSDDAYAGGWASGPGLSFMCAARTPRQGSVIDSNWFELSVPRPWHLIVEFGDPLIPDGPLTRSDIVFFLDGTGYRLPEIWLNELAGGWEVELSMADQMMVALQQAERLILQVGSQGAWDIPLSGMAAAWDQVAATCATTWRQTGHPPPNVLSAPVQTGGTGSADLRLIAETYAATGCSDFFNPGPGAFRAANIDGDGIADIIVDHNEITCGTGATRSNFCGASLCSVDIYLSRRFPVPGRPENLLSGSSRLIDLTNGNQALVTTGNLAMCRDDPDCTFIWYWDGSQFTQLPK